MAPILARMAAELTQKPCNAWLSFSAHFDGTANSQGAERRLSLKTRQQPFKAVPAVDVPGVASALNEARCRDVWSTDAVDFNNFALQRMEPFAWST